MTKTTQEPAPKGGEGDIATRVRVLRERLRMTQDELAIKSGVSRSTIAKIEGGNHKLTTSSIRDSLAAAFRFLRATFDDYIEGRMAEDALETHIRNVLDESGAASRTGDMLQRLVGVFRSGSFGVASFDRVRGLLPELEKIDVLGDLRDDEMLGVLLVRLMDEIAVEELFPAGYAELAAALLRMVIRLLEEVTALKEGVPLADVHRERMARLRRWREKEFEREIAIAKLIMRHDPKAFGAQTHAIERFIEDPPHPGEESAAPTAIIREAWSKHRDKVPAEEAEAADPLSWR